jgi:hypothetical protein
MEGGDARRVFAEVSEDGIWVVQRKTMAKLLVHLHSELYDILAASARREGAILAAVSRPKGDPHRPERCATHGLRKAAARRLAETQEILLAPMGRLSFL